MYRIYDKTLIVIIVLIIGFVILNLNTSVVEGLKNPPKPGKILNNTELNKSLNDKESKLLSGSVATAETATSGTVKATSAAGTTAEPIQTINDVSKPPLPVDFTEVNDYLKKLDAEFAKAKANTDATQKTADEALKQMNTIQKDISTKAVDVQAQVNSINIVKNEIGVIINEMRVIEENVSGIFIGVKESEMNTAQSEEEAKKSAASILPTAANNTVIKSGKSVEGFTGFKSSVLEGYTVYSNPNLPSGSTNNSAFDLENNLVNKINIFNAAYYTYLSQVTPTANQISELTAARTNLDTAITALNVKIGQIGSSTPKISDAVFDASHSYIKTTASQIDTLRSDLDMKMLEILKAKQGMPMDHTINRDAAAYTTILWTALATSALYFIFVKIE